MSDVLDRTTWRRKCKHCGERIRLEADGRNWYDRNYQSLYCDDDTFPSQLHSAWDTPPALTPAAIEEWLDA